MKNPFSRKRKNELSSVVPDEIIVNNPSPIIITPIQSNPSIAAPIRSRPSIVTPIITGSSGSIGVSGSIGISGAQGITGASPWYSASASTWTVISPEEQLERRKKELMKEYEQNPELFSEIIVELRKQKIRQLKEKSTQQ